MHSSTLAAISVTALILSAVILALTITLASWHSAESTMESRVATMYAERTVINPLCNNANLTCTRGVSNTLGGVKVCQLRSEPIGTACTSACYVNGTNTTCDGAQGCVNADPTACKGYCSVDQVTPIYGSGTVCVDKLAFWPFYLPNVPGSSSADYFQWLLYSDRLPACLAQGGCTWFATQFQINLQNNTYLWYTSLPQMGMDCNEFLNSTSTPLECIKSVSIPLGTTTATTIFRNLFNTYAGIPEYWDQFYFEGDICMYQYKCGFQNSSAYVDPAFLLTKRSAEAAATASLHSQAIQHVLTDFEQNPEEARRVLQPQLEVQLEAIAQRRKRSVV